MSHALHITADKGNVRSLSIRALKHENALLDRVSWRAATSAWKPVAVLHWEMQQHGKEEEEIFLKCEARGMQTLTYLLGVKYTHNVFWWGYGKIAFFLCGAYYCFNDGRVLRSSPRCWSCCRKQRGELSWVLSLILPLPTEPEHSANLPRHTINDTWLQSFGSLSRLSHGGRLFSTSNYGLHSSDERQQDTPMSKYINFDFLTLGCLCYSDWFKSVYWMKKKKRK